MTRTVDIVQKLWNLCNDLRDDGVTFHQYVTELTYLLFLKMAKETGQEEGRDGGINIPLQNRWDTLKAASAPDRLDHYRQTLLDLGKSPAPLVRMIYADASSFIRKPATLSKLVTDIDALDWYSAKEEGLGDLYEGLLAKNANEKKSGAGQYFTPRPLIDSIVAVMQPTSDDIIQDPAAGTGGFLIAAHHHITTHEDEYSWPETKQRAYYENAFHGMELVPDTQRLALMNLMLHGLANDPERSGIRLGDTLSSDHQKLPKATLILSNPPFGTKKGGGTPTRDDLTYVTSNKQFAFLQHIYRALKTHGRAAVILPDNVLFESGIGKQIRADLMDKCTLHTILRLPTGIFYAQGVKTNVLFFTRGTSDKGNTKEVWVYDLRANMPHFGKRTPFTREYFTEFETAYGPDPYGGPDALAARVDTGPEGRFRRFTREQIAERGDSLDISWLKDDSADQGDLPEPAQLAEEALTELAGAMEELRAILLELGEDQQALEEAGVLS
ncbi:type I restriction endonuclease [Deinococcus seoulensis]|uniref:site-specific DNA-methyltransferase (adenine-specific) n=1 Tax=Deinococcus seoulensis TaxID=1837379 RepID=A0ABQ2S166_9DEIO|nr:N-6 DNA methylase [Deinococcus seoulensis]GGR75337.1 type I restriction endonuclease [Deinococcus seoulensis]